MSNKPPDPADLPRLPPGLIMAADVVAPWQIRARLVLMLLGFCLRLLNPLCAGGRLYIVDRALAEGHVQPGQARRWPEMMSVCYDEPLFLAPAPHPTLHLIDPA